MARKYKDDHDLIYKAFNEFMESIDLQSHQADYCAAEQKIVFFGGKNSAPVKPL